MKCFGLFTRKRKIFVTSFFVNIKMTQFNSLNVKLSNSQLNKLKSAI